MDRPRLTRARRPRRTTRVVAGACIGLLFVVGVTAAGCTSAPPAPSAAPSTAGDSSGTEVELLDAGMRAARLIDPSGETHEQEWLCLGLELQRDPALGEAATRALQEADVNTRKKLLRVFADCVGPDALVDIYVAGHQIGADRRACVKQLLLAQGLDPQIEAVAGDGDAGDVFAKRVASQCPEASPTTQG